MTLHFPIPGLLKLPPPAIKLSMYHCIVNLKNACANAKSYKTEVEKNTAPSWKTHLHVGQLKITSLYKD
jgi:hypothetical protein